MSNMEKTLLNEAMNTLKYLCADADKIVHNCNLRDVTLDHITVAAENLRDMAGNQHKRLSEILEINERKSK